MMSLSYRNNGAFSAVKIRRFERCRWNGGEDCRCDIQGMKEMTGEEDGHDYTI